MKDEFTEMMQRNAAMTNMCLLFKEEVAMPSSDEIRKQLKEMGYETKDVSDNDVIKVFTLPEITVDYKDAESQQIKKAPYRLMMANLGTGNTLGDETARAQFWNTPNGAELLDSSRWQVLLRDLVSGFHPPKVRAQVLSDWLIIALELFPDCMAVWFDGSQNIMTADSMRNNPYDGFNRIFHGAVNARLFNIDGTEGEMIVDTLGLQAFGAPDVQFHFHKLNPNDVVRMAYNLAIYQFENDSPVENNDTVGGIDENGNYDENLHWKCQYEFAIVEPKRMVLDVSPGIFTAGNR